MGRGLTSVTWGAPRAVRPTILPLNFPKEHTMSNQIELNAASRRQGSIDASPVMLVAPFSCIDAAATNQLSILIDNHQASLAEVDIAIEQDASEERAPATWPPA